MGYLIAFLALIFPDVVGAYEPESLNRVGFKKWKVEYREASFYEEGLTMQRWLEKPWLYNQPPTTMTDEQYTAIYGDAYKLIYQRLLRPDLNNSYQTCKAAHLSVVRERLIQEESLMKQAKTKSDYELRKNAADEIKSFAGPAVSSACIYRFITEAMYSLGVPNIRPASNRLSSQFVAFEDVSLGQILRVAVAIDRDEFLPEFYRVASEKLKLSVADWHRLIAQRNPLHSPERIAVAIQRTTKPIGHIIGFVAKDAFFFREMNSSDLVAGNKIEAERVDSREKNRLAVISSLKSNPQSASFDCKKAGTDVEKMVCSNPVTSHLDGILGATYSDRLNNPNYAVDKKNFKMEQVKWVTQRNLCRDLKCLDSIYYERIVELCSMPVVSGVRHQQLCDEVTGW